VRSRRPSAGLWGRTRVRGSRTRGMRCYRWRAETLTTDAEGRVHSRWRICGFDLAFDFGFRKSGHVYSVTPLKTTRKIAANTAIRPIIPKATGFDALRDSTLRTPCSSCASKYFA
jgi:hypothetical protein